MDRDTTGLNYEAETWNDDLTWHLQLGNMGLWRRLVFVLSAPVLLVALGRTIKVKVS